MLQLVLAAFVPTAAVASWVGAAVLPHGDFAYDPDLVNRTGGSVELHEASLKVGQWLADLEPDILLVTTPHGLELGEDYLVYLNSHAAGESPLGDVPHTSGPQRVPLNVSCPAAEAQELLAALQKDGLPVEGLQGFSDSQPLPISWGEILPLTYVEAARARNHKQLPSVLMVGMPLRRFNHSAEMVPELLQLGASMASFIDGLPNKRVAWIVSADLAHTHLASGPYGYCPCAQPFDDAVGRWAAGAGAGAAAEALLKDAAEFQREGASSCGFTGLVALQGALSWLAKQSSTWPWRSQVSANYHPTYYGMMVATYWRLAGQSELQSGQPTLVI